MLAPGGHLGTETPAWAGDSGSGRSGRLACLGVRGHSPRGTVCLEFRILKPFLRATRIHCFEKSHFTQLLENKIS